MQETNYTQKLIAERGGNIRFIRASENGQPCWFYLKLDPTKISEYEQKLKIGNMNISDYGEIIESDWGIYPAKTIIDSIFEKYGFETNS